MYIFLLANIIIVTDRLSEIWLMTTLRKSTIMEKTRYERTKQMISILDYDAGNIKSVEKAVQYLGEEAVITRDRDVIMASDKVILPGVGSFGDAMGKIREYGLENVIYEVVDAGKPFLGICLGLQLLFKTSEESPEATGLGILDGEILRIPDAPGLKIPQIGWNNLEINPNARLFKGLPLAFKQAAAGEGLRGRLAPIPRQLSAGCGMAWLEPEAAAELLDSLAQRSGIELEQAVVLEL